MAILSSIDITLKKWEDGDPSQTTESIKNAIEKIASVEGASQ